MEFQYYWDYGFWPVSGHSSNTEGADMIAAIERLKSKALEAKGVVPRVLAKVESGLDSIIGAEPGLNTETDAAMAPHLSAIADTHAELAGIKSALDILSNGGPPLQGPTTVLPSSVLSSSHVPPVDHGTGDPLRT